MTIFAAVQITSTNDYENNLKKALGFVEEACSNGAKVVALPEAFTFIGKPDENIYKYKQELTGELVKLMAGLAKKNQIYFLAGSIHEIIPGTEKTYNTSLLFSPQGEIISTYRKIHLFDADLSTPVKYKESDSYKAGDPHQLPVIDTEYGKFGMTVCYDLRFPELYRKIAMNGAEIIFVPSAFASFTGRDHWEVLLRARAIENEVYIVAPDQFGYHDEKKESFGNSMIIDPWGKVIARASDREEVIYANIELGYLHEVRKKLPVFSHKKVLG